MLRSGVRAAVATGVAGIVMTVSGMAAAGSAGADTVVPPVPPTPAPPAETAAALAYLAPLYMMTGGRVCQLLPSALGVAGLGSALGGAVAGNAVTVPSVGGVQPGSELAQAQFNAYALPLVACGLVPDRSVMSQCAVDQQVASAVPDSPAVTVPLA